MQEANNKEARNGNIGDKYISPRRLSQVLSDFNAGEPTVNSAITSSTLAITSVVAVVRRAIFNSFERSSFY